MERRYPNAAVPWLHTCEVYHVGGMQTRVPWRRPGNDGRDLAGRGATTKRGKASPNCGQRAGAAAEIVTTAGCAPGRHVLEPNPVGC